VKPLWKLSLAITGVVLMFLMWQCGSGLLRGKRQANYAVHDFHLRLNSGEYEAIYSEADEGFRLGQTHDDLMRLLKTIHDKMGTTESEKQVSLNVSTNVRGTLITSVYETKFSNGVAHEKFTWVQKGDALKLFAYNIVSNVLVAK
jgi:hypothetical protein